MNSSPLWPFLINFFPYFIIFLLVYVFVILPQKKKKQQFERRISGLQKGDWIMTEGGLWGRFVSKKDNSIFIDLNKGVTVEVDRQSVSRVGKDS